MAEDDELIEIGTAAPNIRASKTASSVCFNEDNGVPVSTSTKVLKDAASSPRRSILRHDTTISTSSENENGLTGSDDSMGLNSSSKIGFWAPGAQRWKYYCFVLLYLIQLVGSPFFLYWLVTDAW